MHKTHRCSEEKRRNLDISIMMSISTSLIIKASKEHSKSTHEKRPALPIPVTLLSSPSLTDPGSSAQTAPSKQHHLNPNREAYKHHPLPSHAIPLHSTTTSPSPSSISSADTEQTNHSLQARVEGLWRLVGGNV